MRKDKKEDEEGGAGGANPFSNIEKTTVLQEARVFNETPVNPRKCGQILAKILYMINKGETLGTREATECFFAITKLFQSKDPVLRRMVYLGIKFLAPIAEDVIIVTSSLTKDMTGTFLKTSSFLQLFLKKTGFFRQRRCLPSVGHSRLMRHHGPGYAPSH